MKLHSSLDEIEKRFHSRGANSDAWGEFFNYHENDVGDLLEVAEAQQQEIKRREQYESFLKSVIRSGEIITEEQTFAWFCESIDE